MYLTQDFIQNKFITGQAGQKFFFSDKTVIDLVNLEQRVSRVFATKFNQTFFFLVDYDIP